MTNLELLAGQARMRDWYQGRPAADVRREKNADRVVLNALKRGGLDVALRLRQGLK